MIRENVPITPQTGPQQGQTTEPPVKQSLDKRLINFFKNFEIKPTKGKLFVLLLLSGCLVLLYASLILLSKKPETLPPPVQKKEVQQEASPASKKPDLEALENKISDFNTSLDKLENFRTNYSPPEPDLNITFK